MKTLLQINSSLFSTAGASTTLADRVVARWRAANPGGRVLLRDLAADPVPHLTAETFEAFGLPRERRNGSQALAVAYSDQLIAELVRADTVVLALPMYNFGVPSTLKAYFDQVARAGVTFRYNGDGPVGLLRGKRAIVVATRGGRYAGTPLDTQTDFVRMFLAFVGIDDVEFVYAEGLALGPAVRDASLAEASARLDRIVDAPRLAA
ncbi:MAG TPA: NAD(P)H-dependent oxidoreductase [Candidatus Saccharimonadia bacterium]|nr:NAD(P)H-dependent oxidoreductase [Candidatus Saccharimonadia bacterium]